MSDSVADGDASEARHNRRRIGVRRGGRERVVGWKEGGGCVWLIDRICGLLVGERGR